MINTFIAEIGIGLIFLWLIVGTVIECVITDKYDVWWIATPKTFYDNTNMNWFGCVFCYILMRIISPIITICIIVVGIIYGVCCFVYWLFTVGRNNDEE